MGYKTIFDNGEDGDTFLFWYNLTHALRRGESSKVLKGNVARQPLLELTSRYPPMYDMNKVFIVNILSWGFESKLIHIKRLYRNTTTISKSILSSYISADPYYQENCITPH